MDTSDSDETTNPHGDMGHGGVAQAITKSQRGDDNTQNWESEVLNHALVHVLDKDKVDANKTKDFAAFVIGNGIDDAHFLLTMLEDNFKSMGHNIDFKTFCSLQASNKMCNE